MLRHLNAKRYVDGAAAGVMRLGSEQSHNLMGLLASIFRKTVIAPRPLSRFADELVGEAAQSRPPAAVAS